MARARTTEDTSRALAGTIDMKRIAVCVLIPIRGLRNGHPPATRADTTTRLGLQRWRRPHLQARPQRRDDRLRSFRFQLGRIGDVLPHRLLVEIWRYRSVDACCNASSASLPAASWIVDGRSPVQQWALLIRPWSCATIVPAGSASIRPWWRLRLQPGQRVGESC